MAQLSEVVKVFFWGSLAIELFLGATSTHDFVTAVVCTFDFH